MATYEVTITVEGLFVRPGQLTNFLKERFTRSAGITDANISFTENPNDPLVLDGVQDAAYVDIGKKPKQATVEFSEEENVSNYRSRAREFEDAQGEFENVVTTVEGLIEGLESWRDNMPESLQGGSKSEEIGAAIEPLETLRDELQAITWPDVDFPTQ